MQYNRKTVRRLVAAAVSAVLGEGSPPTGPDAVEEYLGTQIRVVLGPGAPPAERKKQARLIALRTNDRLEDEYGKPARRARSDMLTAHERETLSFYAGEVCAALDKPRKKRTR